jgi:hypothetical protein
MLAPLAAALLALAMPWDGPPPPPKGAELVLTQPPFPDPPPEGSVIDVPDDRQLPLNWRSTEKTSAKTKGNAGLPSLAASASGQFSRDQFYAVREVLRAHRVVVVDLRQEPHTFLDGAAISWGPPDIVGNNRTADQVERVERSWTARANAKKFATVTQFAPGALADQKSWQPLEFKLDIREARVEADLVAEAHWGYFRVAAPDAAIPRDQDVDRFVAMARDLHEDIWLHFHDDTGLNRATMFLTLYDMMRNYVRANRAEILARQHRLAGYNLLAGPAKSEREVFLGRFFDYCWECGPRFRRSWSSWSRATP